jgi:hypothetical protein
VIVVSDGWDRDDSRRLAREVEHLQLQARRLVWINPRPTELGGQPLAMGMRAALPFVGDYLLGDRHARDGRARPRARWSRAGRPDRRQRPTPVLVEQGALRHRAVTAAPDPKMGYR